MRKPNTSLRGYEAPSTLFAHHGSLISGLQLANGDTREQCEGGPSRLADCYSPCLTSKSPTLDEGAS